MIAAALVVSSMLFDRKIRQDARKVTTQAADNTAAGLNVLSFLKYTDRSVSGSRDAGGTAED